MESHATKRWMLGVALTTALLGLMLKLTDAPGVDPDRGAAESTPAPRGERATPPAGAVDRPGSLASSTSPGGEDRGRIAREGDDGAAAGPRPGATALRAGTEGTVRMAREESLPQVRARSRVPMQAAREAGSLATRFVGEEASGGSGLREPRAGRNQQAGATDAPAADAAPTPTDIAFDSGDAQYQTDARVEVPDVGKVAGTAGTLSFWLQPGWQEGNQDDATLMELGDGRLQVIKNVGFLRFEFLDDGGNKGGVGAPIGDWKAGEWHQVTTTWDGRQYALYVDGQLVSQTLHEGRVDLPRDAKLYIGSNFPEGRPVAPGTIGSVGLHNRPLGPAEVARDFTAVVGKNTARAGT
jgi:hypothetical protein